MKVVAVIPARLTSMRLPRKMLRQIHGRPLVLWAYDAVRKCTRLDDVILATDSQEILEACQKHGCNVRLTSPKHRSGTERVHEVSQSVTADVYINVQGDEPMVRSEQIDTIIELMAELNQDQGTTLILVTHDLELASRARRTIRLADGRLSGDTAA